MLYEHGPQELYDAEAERNSMYCDGCGGYHAGACRPSSEPCDECENEIPDSAPSMVNRHHKPSCSLYKRG